MRQRACRGESIDFDAKGAKTAASRRVPVQQVQQALARDAAG